jgi:hypothetical protein
MKKLNIIIVLLFILYSGKFLSAQEDINLWADHLPYNEAHTVEPTNDKVFVAAQMGIYYYDKEDESLNRLSKVNDLNDTDIATIGYNEDTDILLVVYENANIDFIYGDMNIINFPDIKRASITGDRSINKILFRGSEAYLSCGFGIVIIDLEKREVKDTWYIGPEGSSIRVNDLTYNPETNEYFAATESGIYKADADAPNLAFYEYWERITNFPDYIDDFNEIEYFAGRIFFNAQTSEYGNETIKYFEGTSYDTLNVNSTSDVHSIRNTKGKLVISYRLSVRTYDEDLTYLYNLYTYGGENLKTVNPFDAVYDPKEDKVMWIADRYKGLIKSTNMSDNMQLLVNGPYSEYAYDMDAVGSTVWIASGGRDATFAPEYLYKGIYYYKDYFWNNINREGDTYEYMDTIGDFTSVAIDPGNENHVFVGTWGHGLMEFQNEELVTIHNKENSPLDGNIAWEDAIQIGGIAFDNDRNLWVSNSGAENQLHVKTIDGNWYSFNLGGALTGAGIHKISIDSYGNVWLICRLLSGSVSTYKVAVYKHNNTFSDIGDDDITILDRDAGTGALPGDSKIHAVIADRDGEVWIASDKGPAVIYTPENVFSNGNFDAQRILINRNDGSGLADILLENEGINTIEIDGANRKWFGTQNAGAFLMSQDGTQEIHHFTAENSRLLSNNVLSITIDDDGLVFFGTDKGIVSFKSDAIPPKETNEFLKVYPNPVPPSYKGNINISDLMEDAEVRITDISGNLVFVTTASGGLAIWNGNNMYGERVHSGVYLVFVVNEDGTDSNVGKILFLK